MYDFIGLGDIIVDAFIKLKDAEVSSDRTKLTIPFGDKIPYESVEECFAVGNASNASVSASRLGLKTAFVTNLGADLNGDKCMEKLSHDGVSTEFVARHLDKRTNYHYVLWYGDDRTILVNHEAYERVLPPLGKPRWLYLSSLGSDTAAYHGEIAEYLKANPEVNLAFQPGTFQMELGYETLKDIYAHTHIFFSNVDEAGRILGMNTLGIEELLKRMKELGPKIVVITDGPKGAYAYDGTNVYKQLTYPDPKPPLERTGAGDAFASTTVAALALGKSLKEALEWGAINSMSVVQEVGAQKGLLTREQIEKYLK